MIIKKETRQTTTIKFQVRKTYNAYGLDGSLDKEKDGWLCVNIPNICMCQNDRRRQKSF